MILNPTTPTTSTNTPNLSSHPSHQPTLPSSSRTENYVIVRPPPGKQSHSLSLQIQLLLPPSINLQSTTPTTSHYPSSQLDYRERDNYYNRRPSEEISRNGSVETGLSSMGGSFDAVASASVSASGAPPPPGSGSGSGSGFGPPPPLKTRGSDKAPSIRSNRSVSSSIGSSSLGVGAAGGGRRVTPLYNLNNQLLNNIVVTDAGTDAKIAKFLKKGVEIIGLAVLDPTNLGQNLTGTSLVSVGSTNRKTTFASGATTNPQPSSPSSTLDKATIQSSESTSLLNKFKKFSFKSSTSSSSPVQSFFTKSESNQSLNATASSSTLTSPAPVPPSPSPPKIQVLRPPPSSTHDNPNLPVSPIRTKSSGSQSPVGDIPVPSSSIGVIGNGRTVGYSWMVRKWLRPDLMESDRKGESAGGVGGGGAQIAVDLRFEWRRSPKRFTPHTNFTNSGLGSGSMSGTGARPISPAFGKSTDNLLPPPSSHPIPISPTIGQRGRRGSMIDSALNHPTSLVPTSPSKTSFDLSRSLPSSSSRTHDWVNPINPPPLEGELATTDPNNLVPASRLRNRTTIPHAIHIPPPPPPNIVSSSSSPSFMIGRTTGLEAKSNGSGGGRLSHSRSRSPAAKSISGNDGLVVDNADNDNDDDIGGDGQDSDPEDSERTWVCEVIYAPSGGGGGHGGGGGATMMMIDQGAVNEKRILLGTLTPAPHHPKLVGHLAVPMALSPLPFITRFGSDHVVPSTAIQSTPSHTSLALSVEEMKDILSVTCLWLIVREHLGGLGKRKKGEGIKRPI